MKTLNTVYETKNELEKFIKKENILNSNKVLLQIFSGVPDENYLNKIQNEVKEFLPNINIIGSTTDGEIIGTETTSFQTILSFSIFDKTKIKVYSTNHEQNSYKTAQKIIQEVKDIKKAKVMICFTNGLNTNGEIFLKCFKNENIDLVISGGLSGDNATFKKTFQLDGKEVTKDVVCAFLYNDDLNVYTDYSFGWKSIGREFTVTNAYSNRVFTLDNMTTNEVYDKYLGEEIGSSLPATGIEFPLITIRDNQQIARAVLEKHKDGSLTFAGNLNVGDKVKLGYGNVQLILQNRETIYKKMNKNPIQSIFLYSCMARKRLMNSFVKEEIEPISTIAPTSGFFTYGEFYSNKNNKNLLNETMTILALSESNKIEQKEKYSFRKNDKNSKTIKALSHLVNETTEELEEEIELSKQKDLQLFEQAKNASMGEMLANIAHQWRQPLSAITLEASTIQVQALIDKLSNQEALEGVEKIIKYSKYLSDTVEVFRNFLKHSENRENHSIQKEIQEAIQITNAVLEDNNIKLIEEKMIKDYKIKMLKGELSQVLINLINNAKDVLIQKQIKYATIKVSTNLKEDTLIIKVEDNAGGVKEEIKNRIFEPYYTTKHKSQGTGLGLYMSKRIVTESLMGVITVNNTPHGALFEIYLKVQND